MFCLSSSSFEPGYPSLVTIHWFRWMGENVPMNLNWYYCFIVNDDKAMVVAPVKQSVFWTTRDNLWQLTIGRNQMWTLGKLHSVKIFRGIVHIVIWHVLQIWWEFQMFSSYVDFLNTETWKYGKVDQSISGENGTRGKDVGSGIGGPLLHIPECFRVFGNLLLSISPNTLTSPHVKNMCHTLVMPLVSVVCHYLKQ